jgi:uncharacterized iron-regulated membrane protein
VRDSLRRIHRWLALGCALLWLSQAVTGLLMVYRWELDDARLGASQVPLDPAALGSSIAALEAGSPARKVTQLYTTGGVEGRFDLYTTGAGGRDEIIRVDGAGRVLRARPDSTEMAAGFIPLAAKLHQTLFAGDVGHVVVGISGLILLVSLISGTVLAWPRKGQFRAVVFPRRTRPGAARRYAWHRALGLWFGLPATVVVAAGVLLVFYDPVERWLGADATPPELESVAAFAGEPIPPARAITTALDTVPGSQLSGAAFPRQDRPWYRVRLLQPEEWRRVYGTTVVYVAAADGRVILVQDALASTPARAFLDNLYPVHTGEAGGVVGRLMALLIAGWLLGMLVLGVGLWRSRTVRRPAGAAARSVA